MKNYLFLRCALGIAGSIVAIALGIGFLVEGMKASYVNGLTIGILAILGGILGIIICFVLLKKIK